MINEERLVDATKSGAFGQTLGEIYIRTYLKECLAKENLLIYIHA